MAQPATQYDLWHAERRRKRLRVAKLADDVMTFHSDVQTIFDNMPVKDKKLFWIEGATRRFDGYNYFPKNPKQMIEWFDAHMG